MLDDAFYEEAKAEAMASLTPPDEAAETLADTADVAAVSDEDSAAQETSEDTETEEVADEDESLDESDDSAADEVDSDNETGIPTAEDINARFSRVPKEARTEMIGLADRLREREDTYNAIGGEKGAEVLKPLAGLLSKAETTVDDRLPALTAMITANPGVTWNMGMDMAEAMLQVPDLRVLGNKVTENIFGATVDELTGFSELKAKYGEKADPKHIGELLTLEQAGMIDPEQDMELFRANYGGSELFESQQTTIQALKQEIEAIKANPAALIKQEPVAPATNELDKEIEKRFETVTEKTRNLGGWKKGSYLDTITTKAIQAELREFPEYKEIVKAISQMGTFNTDSMVVFNNLNQLSNKVQAKYREAVKSINAELKGVSTSTPNAKRAATGEATKPKAASISQASGSLTPVDATIDSLWDEFRGSMSDRQAAASRSV